MVDIKAANDNVEISAISRGIFAGIEAAKTATGVEVANAEVKELPGDIAGEYHLDTKEIKADVDVMASGNAELVAHVLTHEAWHAANKAKGDKSVIADVNLEEALTEAATADTTGRIIAYQEHAHLIDDVAQATDTTRRDLIDLYKRGRNERLNQLYTQEQAKVA